MEYSEITKLYDPLRRGQKEIIENPTWSKLDEYLIAIVTLGNELAGKIFEYDLKRNLAKNDLSDEIQRLQKEDPKLAMNKATSQAEKNVRSMIDGYKKSEMEMKEMKFIYDMSFDIYRHSRDKLSRGTDIDKQINTLSHNQQ